MERRSTARTARLSDTTPGQSRGATSSRRRRSRPARWPPRRRSIPGAWAAGSDEIRVGVIGCGGRGTGAMQDALKSSKGVRLVAMAELSRIGSTRAAGSWRKHRRRATVPDDRAFAGLDAYKKVLQTDANYVILATPPGFRPPHLKAAIEAGKHVFTEKPVAVDGPGIRTCCRWSTWPRRRSCWSAAACSATTSRATSRR